MGDTRLVGLTEAAALTGRSREWLRRLANAGKIDGAVRVGRTIGIPEREVERLKVTPKKPGGWPKGKARKPSPLAYGQAGEHATGRLLRAADDQVEYRTD